MMSPSAVGKGLMNFASFTLSSSINSAAKQAYLELKLPGEKQFFSEVEPLLDFLDGSEKALVLLDWDIGFKPINDLFEKFKSRPQREYWQILLVVPSTDPSMFQAGVEWGVQQVFVGEVNATKIKKAFESLIEADEKDSLWHSVMKNVREVRELDDHVQALSILSDIYAAEPDNLRIAYEIAASQLELGQHEESTHFLEPLVEAHPEDVRLIFLMGKNLLKLGRFAEAADFLKRADLINPYHPDRLIDLGHALLNLEKTQEACESFERAQELDPDHLEAPKGVGAVKMLEGQVNEAIKLLQGKISLRELASVFNTAAVIAIRLEQFQKGVNLYESAQVAVGADNQVLAKVFFNKGLGYLRWSKELEAKASFAKAVDLDPKHKNARRNLVALEAGQKYVSKPTPMPPPPTTSAEEETIIDGQEIEPDMSSSVDDYVEVFQIPVDDEDPGAS